MDNIQKMVLGMVAIVAVVVLIMPQGNPLPEKAAVQSAEPENTTPENTQNKDNEGVETSGPPPTNESAPNPSANTEVTNFGQPMMDPTPAAERAEREQREQARQQQMARQGGQQEGPTNQQDGYNDDDLNTSGPAY
jgi:hypothetical protein